MTPEEKSALVNSYTAWWHSIDFGDGVVSRGEKGGGPHVHEQEIKWFPPDFFAGKRVLDVGTWDGYYAFYAERQGASEVVAVDRFVWVGLGGPQRSKRGFDIAKALLKSNVVEYVLDVDEMTPELLGTFDSIIYAGVFYHLKDPFGAIEVLHSLLRPGGRILVETEMRNTGNSAPLLQFHPKSSLNNDPTNFFSPNGACVRAMFEEVGDYAVENMSEGSRGTVVLRRLT